jgi:hypothetical protein
MIGTYATVINIGNANRLQLSNICRTEVERWISISASATYIFLSNGIDDFIADFEAFATDVRSNGCHNVLGASVKDGNHFVNSMFRNALCSTTPASMNDGNDILSFVEQNYWYAVGSENEQTNAAQIGDECIGSGNACIYI